MINSKDFQFIKTPVQNYFGGFQNAITYKQLELSLFLQFVKQTGNNYLNVFPNAGVFTPTSQIQNQPAYVLARWQKSGDITDVQRFTTRTNTGPADATITDASFIRLKNVSLSYQLSQYCKAIPWIRSTRVYVQGQNLLTFTRYQGLDPETQGLSLPPLRMFSFGIQAAF
jgi:TonB-dependent starch-binding outer membrane protein SusC